MEPQFEATELRAAVHRVAVLALPTRAAKQATATVAVGVTPEAALARQSLCQELWVVLAKHQASWWA